MNKTVLLILAVLFAGVSIANAGPAETNGISAGERKVLDGIRLAMAARDLDDAKLLLKQAEKGGSPAYVGQLDRLDLVRDYLGQFWTAVSEGTQSLKALDELVVGKTRIAVVEVSRERIVLRVLGQNRRYNTRDMPPKLAVILAQRALADAKQNAVFFATFHLADKSGDRAEAERLLNEAKKAGVEVAALLEELSVAGPTTASIDIPDVTPVMRSLLSSRRWIEMTSDGSRVARQSLTGAEQNAEGRLVIAAADQPRIIAFQTRLAANFGCRLVLQCEAMGLKVGLHSTTDPNQAVAIEIPAGTNLIEIARQRGQWQCRLNNKPLEVQIADGTSPRMSGNLGFSLPEGQGCTIAAIELRTR